MKGVVDLDLLTASGDEEERDKRCVEGEAEKAVLTCKKADLNEIHGVEAMRDLLELVLTEKEAEELTEIEKHEMCFVEDLEQKFIVNLTHSSYSLNSIFFYALSTKYDHNLLSAYRRFYQDPAQSADRRATKDEHIAGSSFVECLPNYNGKCCCDLVLDLNLKMKGVVDLDLLTASGISKRVAAAPLHLYL
ncbi:hypothetical protein Aperf_G00000054939 [Anoplocephala perfoliata]